MMRAFFMVWLAALVFGTEPTFAQSIEQVRAFQNFEAAKAAGNSPEALKLGKTAVQLTEAASDRTQLIELLCNVGDYAAHVGADEQANQYYGHALKLQEAALGTAHPDLVPVLTALAQLSLKDKRYADAEAQFIRIAAIERAVYGDRHENTLATLQDLRALYQTTGNADGVARLDAQLEPPPAPVRGSLPRPAQITGERPPL